MRTVTILLLGAAVAFTAIAVLPAPIGLLSLARALVFVAGAACLVAVVPVVSAWLLRGSGVQRRLG